MGKSNGDHPKVAIVCPRCAAPAATSAQALDAAGRTLSCARCGTRWMPRVHDREQFSGQRDQPGALPASKGGRPRFERVIDHIDKRFSEKAPAPPKTPAEPDPGPPVRRRISMSPGVTALSGVAAVALFVVVSIIAFDSQVVGAWSDGRSSEFAGLEIQLVHGTTEPIRDGHAVNVLGEITNHTNDEIAVPAVRLSVQSDGGEVFSWIVEPTTTRLAGGGAVRFRSLFATPFDDFDEVSLRLADRRTETIGAH